MNRRCTSSHPEAGYILLAVLFMVALLLVTLAVAAPSIAADIQRDREAELVHRGEQYKHAIKLYYKKFGRYPSTIDQLEDTNKMRFLRKRYTDPMTGKDDWKIIHQGEAHVKAMGLFGQPIQNGGLSTTAGSTAIGGTPSLTGPSSTLGAGSSTISPMNGTTGSTDTSGSSGTSTPGSGTSAFGGTSASAFGSGQTLGGAPIVGVASKSTKASIKEYKKQKHYNEWEFVYDPVEDLMNAVSLFGGGNSSVNGNSGSPNTFGNPGSSTGTGFGTGTGTSGSFGGGFSSSPSPSPQQ
ncbi:MAG TPA: hypothetical protein VHB45_12440 [Alloacidobacterium sp.]|nr:hypothetical protein [Alloacidobacterium sp.]